MVQWDTYEISHVHDAVFGDVGAVDGEAKLDLLLLQALAAQLLLDDAAFAGGGSSLSGDALLLLRWLGGDSLDGLLFLGWSRGSGSWCRSSGSWGRSGGSGGWCSFLGWGSGLLWLLLLGSYWFFSFILLGWSGLLWLLFLGRSYFAGTRACSIELDIDYMGSSHDGYHEHSADRFRLNFVLDTNQLLVLVAWLEQLEPSLGLPWRLV